MNGLGGYDSREVVSNHQPSPALGEGAEASLPILLHPENHRASALIQDYQVDPPNESPRLRNPLPFSTALQCVPNHLPCKVGTARGQMSERGENVAAWNQSKKLNNENQPRGEETVQRPSL